MPLSLVSWDNTPYVHRFHPTWTVDYIPFPGTTYSEWTLEMRYMKVYTLSQGILSFPGWIVIDGNNDGSVDITLGSSPSPFTTKTFLQLDQWNQLALISRASGTTTELYVNGIYFCDVPQRGDMLTGSVGWKFPNNYIAIKDMKIWTEAMPLNFLN